MSCEKPKTPNACKLINTMNILNSNYLRACCISLTQPGTATCTYLKPTKFVKGEGGGVVPFFKKCKGKKGQNANIIKHCMSCLHSDIFNIYTSICSAEEIAGQSKTIRDNVITKLSEKFWGLLIDNVKDIADMQLYADSFGETLGRNPNLTRAKGIHRNFNGRKGTTKTAVNDWITGYLNGFNQAGSNAICAVIMGVLRYGRTGVGNDINENFKFDDCAGLGGCMSGFIGTWIRNCSDEEQETVNGFLTSTEDEIEKVKEAETVLCDDMKYNLKFYRWKDDTKYRNSPPPNVVDIEALALVDPIDAVGMTFVTENVDCYGSYLARLPASEGNFHRPVVWNTAVEGIKELNRLSDDIIDKVKDSLTEAKLTMETFLHKAQKNKLKFTEKLLTVFEQGDRLFKVIDHMLLAGAFTYQLGKPLKVFNGSKVFQGSFDDAHNLMTKTNACWNTLNAETYMNRENIDKWPVGSLFKNFVTEPPTEGQNICVPKATFDQWVEELRLVQKDFGKQCQDLEINNPPGFTYQPCVDDEVRLPYDPTTNSAIVYYKYPPAKSWTANQQAKAGGFADCTSSPGWELMQGITNILNETRLPCGGSPLHTILQFLDPNANTQEDGRGPIGGSSTDGCRILYNWPNDYYRQPVDQNGALPGSNKEKNKQTIGSSLWELPSSCGVYPVIPTQEEFQRLALSILLLHKYIQAIGLSDSKIGNSFAIVEAYLNARVTAMGELKDLIPEECIGPLGTPRPAAVVKAIPPADVIWKDKDEIPAPEDTKSPLVWWSTEPGDGDIEIPE